ncbi:hypothetical protein M409DRAFT_59390 [Zasmidium cellare ATCC 36951]|uniref:Uncharacterized protein n=1 Tax=Zasmidium cellare ATCC 36951 TaxID=1080233 RepID=A0A6A6C214_ZASCE|nr:uncharacterized protein M409DRAFT_59390 [Zasmidium cellare ATCC 36951]KAF2161127.1 hypothetical protein M409DRAFT_59390 [Zasmidium cellare ATCC 36951]
MASNGSEGNGWRRSRREKHLSDKARLSLDDGEQIPGLDQSSPPPTSLSKIGDISSHDFSLQENKVGKSPINMVRTDKTKSTAVATPDIATSPAFAANSFMLDGWPRTLPEDVVELHAKWGDRKDHATTADIIETYGDDGADDWDDFAGNPNLYPKPGDLERAVGSTLNRAKSAFRANKSWEQFEADEEALSSMRMAMLEHDPERHKILLRECLNNDLRLKVFNQLKERLCTEIWKREYVPTVEAAVPLQPPSARTKKDSKVTFSNEVAEGRKKQTEPVEQDEYSVRDWHERHPVWNVPEGQYPNPNNQDYRAHFKHIGEGQPRRWDCLYCRTTREQMGHI